MEEDAIKTYREFLKDSLRLIIDFSATDQNRGVEPPPVQKPAREDQERIPLPGRETWGDFAGTDLVTAVGNRKSHRRFKDELLSLAELAFLLWSTQGIREIVGPGCAYRVVPSAGCRHSFETYLVVSSVGGLAPGVYRYLPVEHALVFEGVRDNLQAELTQAALNQTFAAAAPVVFVWATVPYRMEWRYGLAAHRVIAMDAGHVCQNLYLASQAVGCGTCAIAAYHQEGMDRLLGLDGEDEFTLYMAPVGKV